MAGLIENLEEVDPFLIVPEVVEENNELQEHSPDQQPPNRRSSESRGVGTSPNVGVSTSSYHLAIDGGTKVGQKIVYYPNRILGMGGMGAKVCEGKLEGIRKIAVKRIDQSFYDFIENEIKLLSTSDSHKNVIRYFCNEVQGEFRYIALELCQASLVDYVRKTDKGRMIGSVDIYQVLEECASGLNYIHSKKIVHRDIKPSNILLQKDGEVIITKITDFGLGKKLKEDEMSYTNSGNDTGTQAWQAPEVALNKDPNKKLNAKVDVFGLGCVYYYSLTGGRHPFGDLGDRTYCQFNIRNGDHRRIVISDDTRGVAELITRMISLNPEQRPPTSAILDHIVFWDEQKVANFFEAVKDIHTDRRDWIKDVIQEFNLGTDKVFEGDWLSCLPSGFQKHLRQDTQRNYNGVFIRDLVRAVRNTHTHYEKLPFEIKIEIESRSECVRLWLRMFPNLLPYTWKTFEPLKDQSGFKDRNFYNTRYDFFKDNHDASNLNE